MKTTKEYSVELGGKTLTATFTDLANQAHGSVLLSYGKTVVLATAVMSEQVRAGLDYFPLTVEYEEKFYATGRILGSQFVRREGKPSDEAVLSGRAIDRTVRPLFDHALRNEVQVVVTVLSIAEDDPDVLAINAASLALATSDIPWNGPVSAVRLGRQRAGDAGGSDWVVNPEYVFRHAPEFETDVLVCGTGGLVTMIEAGAAEIPEDALGEGLARAVEELAALNAFQQKIVADIGRGKRAVVTEAPSDAARELFARDIAPLVREAVFSKGEAKHALVGLAERWRAALAEHLPEENGAVAARLLDECVNEEVHRGALERGERADGRGFDDLRPLFAKAGGVSEVLHGSGIFYRGGTHVFSALTLGGPKDSLLIDGMEVREKKRFMHHYNFPPFSTGETGRIGGFNRRMIGHGALAEKALRAVIPGEEAFPYTIRIVSEAMASNGSTSMGSVCGSTLALLDAGVPIAAPVAGIAMGLVTDERGAYKILTDIAGAEDHHGDMDLKVAGTERGVTAIQMDVKVAGVAVSIVNEAIARARAARLKILKVIADEIPAPRASLNPNAPQVVALRINPEDIGKVIGGGGKTVNAVRAATGTDIDIEDDGAVAIVGVGDGPARAKELIEQLTRRYAVGERLEGVVVKILDFGAFVRLSSPALEALNGNGGHATEGLVHISEIAPFRIARVEDALSVGERVPVVVKEIDGRDRINLSIKLADPEFSARKGLSPAPASSAPTPNSRTSHYERPNQHATDQHRRPDAA